MNSRIRDIMRLLDKQVSRKLAFLGANGVASEQMAAFQNGDGWFSHADMNAKIQDITPPMPQEVFAEVHEFERMFDEMSGITPTLAGRGDAGVRSADHAETLVRMSSPRLRDRALLIEHQVAELGDLCFQLMQEKDGRQYTARDGTEFYLKTMPEDYSVTVDAHSASPVFVDDAMRHAMILKQQGAIDEEDLLLLTSPPMLPTLLKKLRERKAAQAEFAKEHPEILAKQMQHRKK